MHSTWWQLIIEVLFIFIFLCQTHCQITSNNSPSFIDSKEQKTPTGRSLHSPSGHITNDQMEMNKITLNSANYLSQLIANYFTKLIDTNETINSHSMSRKAAKPLNDKFNLDASHQFLPSLTKKLFGEGLVKKSDFKRKLKDVNLLEDNNNDNNDNNSNQSPQLSLSIPLISLAVPDMPNVSHSEKSASDDNSTKAKHNQNQKHKRKSNNCSFKKNSEEESYFLAVQFTCD